MDRNKQPTTKVPNKSLTEVIAILPAEKSDNAIGRTIVPYKK
jgi:hypothetical protein